MLYKTRGIVLRNLPYNDKYAIAGIYTENFGLVSYLVSKAAGKKAKLQKALFHTLAVLDMEVEHFNLRDIHRIKEAQAHILLPGLLNDPVKSSISFFLAEFISHVLKDVQPNRLLFDYIFHSVSVLDLLDKGAANFHLVFMTKMSSFLGFYPNADGYQDGMYFDLCDGVFVKSPPAHPHFLPASESKFFLLLLRMNYENMQTFRFSRHDRINIITRILEYYRIHLTAFPELKSLEVMQAIFE